VTDALSSWLTCDMEDTSGASLLTLNAAQLDLFGERACWDWDLAHPQKRPSQSEALWVMPRVTDVVEPT